MKEEHKFYNNVTFNHKAGTAVSTNGVFKVPGCIQDVMSAIYYARNINFDKYKPGDKIPFDMFLDDEVYHLYISYMGKEKLKHAMENFMQLKLNHCLLREPFLKAVKK